MFPNTQLLLLHIILSDLSGQYYNADGEASDPPEAAEGETEADDDDGKASACPFVRWVSVSHALQIKLRDLRGLMVPTVANPVC